MENQLKQFHIYHSIGKDKFQEVEKQPREYVGFTQAISLENAFANSQNIDQAWNPSNPCRSTSVGDVIQAEDGFYMVLGMGFKLLDDLSENDSQLNNLESQTYE